jgi:hypothetical protein
LVLDALEHAFFTRAQEGNSDLRGLIAHSDAGAQGGFNRSSQHRPVGSSLGVRRGFGWGFPSEGLAGHASCSASATPTTNAAAYGGPAPANHGESHPAGTNATAKSEEPVS